MVCQCDFVRKDDGPLPPWTYVYNCSKNGQSKEFRIPSSNDNQALELCKLECEEWKPVTGTVIGGGGGCLDAKTMVWIQGDEFAPIEEVEPGRYITLSYDPGGETFFAPVTGVEIEEHDMSVEVAFENGEIVNLSRRQAIVTECGLVQARYLSPGAKVISADVAARKSSNRSIVKSISLNTNKIKTYSLSFEADFFFFIGESRSAVRCGGTLKR